MCRETETKWNKKQRILKKAQEELNNHSYECSKKALSRAYGEVHRLHIYYGQLPGVTAYEECLRFLLTKKRFESSGWYKLSLQAALKKVKGRRFVNAEGTPSIIQNTADVHQTLIELFDTAGVEGSVNQIVMARARDIA